jgi:glyoxylase I family protein
MEKINGIGGVFLVAKDPDMLSKWYKQHLGVPLPPASYDEGEWRQPEGPTVFAFMDAEGEHFSGSGKTWGINFRVANLDAMITQLEQAGIAVERDPEEYPNGIFASLKDPEGNLVQLWQPKGLNTIK